MALTLAQRLRKAGIRHYDVLIHKQEHPWLLKNFKAEGSSPGRHVRHPKTGQLIWIPPRLDVDFNPAKGLL